MRLRISILAALALVLAACGGGGTQTAATVDGEDITVADIEQYLSGEAVAEDRFRQELQDVIISTIILGRAETEFGIDPTEEEIETSYQELVSQVEAQAGGDYQAGLDQIGFTDARVRLAAEEQLVGQALRDELSGAEPTDAEIDEAFVDGGTGFYNACVKHILVETDEDAQTVLDRLEAGEEFEAVAQEVSTDSGSGAAGGDLGCSLLDRYVAEFSQGVRDAEIGVPFGPVESQFGFHIILVDSIDDDDTARSNAIAQLGQSADDEALFDWVDAAIADAEVTVDPEYGEWVTDPSPSIIPPADEGSDESPDSDTGNSGAGDSGTGDSGTGDSGTGDSGTGDPGE